MRGATDLWRRSQLPSDVRSRCLRAFSEPELLERMGTAEIAMHLRVIGDELAAQQADHWLCHTTISPPTIDVKLVYDSLVWRRFFSQLNNDEPAHVLELLPGQSLTVPLAILSAGLSCSLVRLDRRPSVCRDPLNFHVGRIEHWCSDLYDSEVSWARFSSVVGNHILDDLLVASWDWRRYTSSFGSVVYARKLWRDFFRTQERSNVAQHIVERLTKLALTLPPGATLVLREYPASFAIFYEIEEQIAAHEQVFWMLAGALRRLPGTVFVEDLSSLPVASISKIPGTMLRYSAPEFAPSSPLLHI